MFVQAILDLSSQSRQQTSRAQAHPLAFNQDLTEKKLNVAEMNGNIKIGRKNSINCRLIESTCKIVDVSIYKAYTNLTNLPDAFNQSA